MIVIGAPLGSSWKTLVLVDFVRTVDRLRVASSFVPSDHSRPGSEDATSEPRSGDDLAAMRVDYAPAGPTDESPDDLDLDPARVAEGWLPVLRRWLAVAVATDVPEPNAMVLATVDDRGRPATRTVLCKKIDENGLTFFTNYESDKGLHLAVHPYASATFLWLSVYRQITVRGPVEPVSAAETAAYWRTRPRGSQLGAWASQQSRPVAERADLERALVEAAERFGVDDEIPVPPFWGGFRIRPETVEFWQGRPNRLHNRVRARWAEDGRWITERLQP